MEIFIISELENNLKRRPNDPATLINLGKAFINLGEIDKAFPLLKRAVKLYPDIFLAQNYLADAYCLSLNAKKALEHYKIALSLRPNDPDVIINMSVCHWQIGEFDAAYECGKLVRDQQPVNFGLLSLLHGDYEQGWQNWLDFWFDPKYRGNWDLLVESIKPADNVPFWNGEAIPDKHLLVLDENQGFGDSIMVARFMNELLKQCNKVTFQTRPELCKLMKDSFPVIDVVAEAKQSYDLQVRLFSLPQMFNITPNNIPSQPYLRADPNDVVRWRDKIVGDFKVGIRWSGSPSNPMDRIRSINDTSVLRPLNDVHGVTFVSLANYPIETSDISLVDVSSNLTDFAAVAALMQSLDLIISVDTGVLNLAGAMGLPTWLMNYRGTDWRWGMCGEQSPWYPSVHIIRQPEMNDWETVIKKIVEKLKIYLT